MDFTEFVRKPFIVQAVEITEDNISEVADLVGELKSNEEGKPFIKVNTRKVPGVFQVFPGFFMTKMGKNIRCYNPDIFKELFCPNEPDIEVWVKFMNGEDIHNDTEELPQPTVEVDDAAPAG